MTVPVALIIFNRPRHTQRVFDRIREHRPSRLLVIADGPRSEPEARQCAAARSVIEQVDWECDVLTHFSDVNLGCDRRVTSGISWVFDQCEEVIILEDDCLPHPSFFCYCAELLEKYRHDERIMTINGSNFHFGRTASSYSYIFSRYPLCWGWATWRRSWQYYNEDIGTLLALRETTWLDDILGDKDAVAYWSMAIDSGQISWDCWWAFSCWLQNSLAITPNANLVSNIGFGPGATRTANPAHRLANFPMRGMFFPLQHPPHMVRDQEADRLEFKNGVPSDIYHRLRRRLGVAMPMPVRSRLYHYVSILERRK